MEKKCKVENCGKKHFSGGYCCMHYTRNRRAGNPDTVKRRGRKKDKFREFTLGLLSDMSPRTVDKYLRFLRIASDAGLTQEEKRALMKQTARPNGTTSFEKYIRLADSILIKQMIDIGNAEKKKG
ncbi:MAG: hypothetical protein ACYCSB_09490 [bacterium]